MKPSGAAGMMLAKLMLTVGVVSAVVIFQVDGSNWKFWSVWAAFPETFRPPEELPDPPTPPSPPGAGPHPLRAVSCCIRCIFLDVYFGICCSDWLPQKLRPLLQPTGTRT